MVYKTLIRCSTRQTRASCSNLATWLQGASCSTLLMIRFIHFQFWVWSKFIQSDTTTGCQPVALFSHVCQFELIFTGWRKYRVTCSKRSWPARKHPCQNGWFPKGFFGTIFLLKSFFWILKGNYHWPYFWRIQWFTGFCKWMQVSVGQVASFFLTNDFPVFQDVKNKQVASFFFDQRLSSFSRC